MANFDKFLDKGNDVLDRAENKAKERQAMSENPEEKKGITAKDMAGAGVDYAKDMAGDKLKEKVADKFQDKFLNKNADDIGNDSGDKSTSNSGDKSAEKSTADNMKDKYLNKNPSGDNLLDNSNNGNPKAAQVKGGNNGGGNLGAKNPTAGNHGAKNGSGKKNAFGDSKNPNDNKSANSFKKDPTAGSNAAKAGSDLAKDAAKDGAKDAAKDLAKDGIKDAAKSSSVAGDAVGAAKNLAQGNVDGAVDDAAAFAAGKAAGYFGGAVADKAVSFATKAILKTEGGKFAKACCCFACLGVAAIAFGAVMLIPMLIAYIMKTIADIIESIPIVGPFVSFIQDKVGEILGLDFGDFDFEDIGLDSTKMEEYANMNQRFIDARAAAIGAIEEQAINEYYYSKDDGSLIKTEFLGNKTCDVKELISEYLSLFSVFSALEVVDKDALAYELEQYFLNEADFEIEVGFNVIVEDVMIENPDYPSDPDAPEQIPAIKKKLEPVFYLQHATSLTAHISYNDPHHVNEAGERVDILSELDATETVTFQEGPPTITPNYEVISMFGKYKWTKAEISTFEYMADTQHPLNTIFNVDVYGFTSTFTMPVDNYVIASEFGDTRAPYSESNPNKGIDILADEDTEVKAIADGTVEAVGSDYITLKMGDDIKVTYSGLKSQPSLAVGASVAKGDVIAYVGANNLHFEVLNKEGKNINPQTFLASTIPGPDALFLEGASMAFYHQGQQPPASNGVSIAYNGCGPTSLAMVLSSPRCGSQIVTPKEIADKAYDEKLWGYGEKKGASWAMFATVAKKYGVTNIKQLAPKENPDEIHKALKNGYPIIFSISGINRPGDGGGRYTKFTNDGHFIVADGFYDDSGYVRILDPNNKAEDEDHWAVFYRDEANKIIDDSSKDGLFTGAKQAWIFYGG